MPVKLKVSLCLASAFSISVYSPSSLPALQVCRNRTTKLTFSCCLLACIYLHFMLIATVQIKNVCMVRPYFDRFPAKLRKRKVCIKRWKRFLTCWQSSLSFASLFCVYFNPYFESYTFKKYYWADVTSIFTCLCIADQRNYC